MVPLVEAFVGGWRRSANYNLEDHVAMSSFACGSFAVSLRFLATCKVNVTIVAKKHGRSHKN